MAYNDFRRSELGIRPKERLMSAGSYINPVRTYDADEQRRIVESFRGLSAQTDKMIDGFIAKQQEKAQAKYDEWLTNTLQDPSKPGHEKVKEAMDKLKPRVANLLGVDYWTTQYIARGQAELLFQQEKQDMLLGYNENGDANKSPDEYVAQLGNYRKASEERVATFPKEVQRYFNKMPRAELMNTMRDKHIKDVMQEQIAARNTILTNKIYDALSNTSSGLFSVLYDMENIDDGSLDTISYGDFLSGDLTKKEAGLIAKLYGWEVKAGDNAKIMSLEHKENIMQYRQLSKNPIIEAVLNEMRQGAAAGAKPNEIKQAVYNGFIQLVQEDETIGDEADILFNIIMDRANKDAILQKESGLWGYVENNKLSNDENIALFDMSNVSTNGQELRRLANQTAIQRQADFEAEQLKNRTSAYGFIDDAYRAGKLTTRELTTMSADEICDKLGLDRGKFSVGVALYQQDRRTGHTIQYSDTYKNAYNDTLTKIRRGTITRIEELENLKNIGYIHPSDYKPLLDELEKGTDLTGGQEHLYNTLLVNVKNYLNTVYPDDKRKVEAIYQDYQNDLFTLVRDGTITNRINGNDYLANSYKARGMDYLQADLYKSNDLQTPQTKKEFDEQALGRMAETAVLSENKKTGEKNVTNQDWFNPYQTFDEFKASDEGQMLIQKYNATDEQLQGLYNNQMKGHKSFVGKEREKYLTDILSGGKYDIGFLSGVVKENPELVKNVTGVEMEIVNGVAVPKDEAQKKYFKRHLKNGDSVGEALKRIYQGKVFSDILSFIRD